MTGRVIYPLMYGVLSVYAEELPKLFPECITLYLYSLQTDCCNIYVVYVNIRSFIQKDSTLKVLFILLIMFIRLQYL
jgi:hypothetical protein